MRTRPSIVTGAAAVALACILSACGSTGATDEAATDTDAQAAATENEQLPLRDDCADPNTQALEDGCQTLDDWIGAFNANDADAFAASNNYPHVRTTGATTTIWQTPAEYLRDNSSETLAKKADAAGFPGWVKSRWDKRQLIQFDDASLHFTVQFSRLDANDEPVSTIRSLYVLTNDDGHWGVQLRSSFAGISNDAAY